MFTLPKLPYAYDALEPVISERTMHFHYDKHHATYVKTLNELLEKAGKSPSSLEEVIRQASQSTDRKLFNNAAQAWNHSFLWAAMTPKPEQPTGDLETAIKGAFGDLAALKTAFITAGVGQFGSGWVWLVADKGGAVSILATHDADDTVAHRGVTPLLVCDVWEHAYYLDHQNDRKAFLDAWFDKLPHWEFAAYQYAAAMGKGEAWRFPTADSGSAKKSA